MGQAPDKTLPFITGAILTLTLLASGFLLGVTGKPFSDRLEGQVVGKPEVAELTEMIIKIELSISSLAGKIDDLEQGLEQLTNHGQGHDAALDTIITEVRSLSTNMASVCPVPSPSAPAISQHKEPSLALMTTVQDQESIWSIANRYQSPPSQAFIDEIMNLNDINPYQLRVGQKLLIPLAEHVFTLVEME